MPVVALLQLHLHHLHGAPIDYVGLALAAFASWVGIPGPGEPVLIAAGVFAARHKLDISPVIVAAAASAAAGGMIGWLIGFKAGHALLTGPGPFRRWRVTAVSRGEQVFRRHPVLAIVLTPSWIAGIHRANPAIYTAINAAGAILWAAGIGLGAYYVGPSVVDFVDDLGLVTGIALAVLIAAAAGAEISRRSRRKRRRQAAADRRQAAADL
jgi:membrane protein DedA with SNARE-associated domain